MSTANDTNFVSTNTLRARFSAAMSAMYKQEVPAYATLLDIVGTINTQTLDASPALKMQLQQNDNLTRISDERHGAIRLGSAAELSLMRRAFALLGMYPVGYYDLSSAGIPVHSTAFRPLDSTALAANPFRLFTSLLRLDLISDDALREQAAAIITQRQIFTPAAVKLIYLGEVQGGLTAEQAPVFISELLHTFRWHRQATVDYATYCAMHNKHRLIADIVCFRGPHINHLTPRTLNIDAVQTTMPQHGIAAKAVIEGPPTRQCPVLLRQTSFRALSEKVDFSDISDGEHTARFGEVEQRGAALTPRGRQRYDELLQQVRGQIIPAADGSNAAEYMAALADGFSALPDDWRTLLDEELAYFTFSLTEAGKTAGGSITANTTIASLIDDGLLAIAPITYEDFLPVSAAGIFQSNLGNNSTDDNLNSANRTAFEEALGAPVADEFGLYETIQTQSLTACLRALADRTAQG